MGGRIEIEIEKCKGCGLCVWACLNGVLEISERSNEMGYYYPIIKDAENCNGCGRCSEMTDGQCIVVYRD